MWLKERWFGLVTRLFGVKVVFTFDPGTFTKELRGRKFNGWVYKDTLRTVRLPVQPSVIDVFRVDLFKKK